MMLPSGDGVADQLSNPAGKISVTLTFCATIAPLFPYLIVNVTIALVILETFVVGLATLVIHISASQRTRPVCEMLFPVFVSPLALIIAVLMSKPLCISTLPVRMIVPCCPGVSVPRFQPDQKILG